RRRERSSTFRDSLAGLLSTSPRATVSAQSTAASPVCESSLGRTDRRVGRASARIGLHAPAKRRVRALADLGPRHVAAATSPARPRRGRPAIDLRGGGAPVVGHRFLPPVRRRRVATGRREKKAAGRGGCSGAAAYS